MDLIRVQPHKEIDLWELLHQMKNDDERFYLPDRIDLVFKVVKIGLLLLGTSWLSDLNSKMSNVFPVLSTQNVTAFLLNAASTSDNDLHLVEPQTFRVGVLIAEIALALPIEDVQRGDDAELKFAMNLSPSSTQELDYVTANEIIYDIYLSAGKVWSRVVEFCLQQSPSSKKSDWQFGSWEEREETYRNTSIDYYNEVYAP
jgi:hypothetical protein